MKNIVIVGGGACGVSTFLELFIQVSSQNLTEKVKITIIEKDTPLGYGLAFGTDQEGHLLNTQADLMGIYGSEPGHFAAWLKEHGGKTRHDVKGEGMTETSYTSRKLYGDYIAAHYLKYLDRAKQVGLSVDVIEDKVLDVKKDAGKFNVIHKNGSLMADFVVLAIATPKPDNYQEFKENPNYLDFPYPSQNILKNIQKEESVGILGSSLSALDAIMTLVDNGHKGEIILFSPDGLLPRVQPIKIKKIDRKKLRLDVIHRIQRKTLKQPQVKDVFRCFQQEVEELENRKIDWKSENRIGKDAAKLLEADIQAAENGGDSFMQVAISMRYDAGIIWNWLNVEEKMKFKKWFGPHWMITRHGMPIPNALKLKQLFEKGKLRVIPFLNGADFEHSKFILTTEKSEKFEVDKLINATGAPSNLEAMHSQLLKNLVENKLLKAYPAGGAVINVQTMEVKAENCQINLYAIGHLVNGVLLDVNAVWFNVKTIQRLVYDIILKLKNGDFS